MYDLIEWLVCRWIEGISMGHLTMKSVFLTLMIVLTAIGSAGCRKRVDPETERRLSEPIVPQGLQEGVAERWRCPENNSTLRFATRRELNDINDRIIAKKLKTWFDEPRTDVVDALLIREDGKIAYRFEYAEDKSGKIPIMKATVPILKIEEALVLDEKVGKPDPTSNRK